MGIYEMVEEATTAAIARARAQGEDVPWATGILGSHQCVGASVPPVGRLGSGSRLSSAGWRANRSAGC